jgi:hypothetical protein
MIGQAYRLDIKLPHRKRKLRCSLGGDLDSLREHHNA